MKYQVLFYLKNNEKVFIYVVCCSGWSGGAMVVGKLPVPGRPANLVIVQQRPAVLAMGAGGGCLDIFSLIYHFSLLSSSVWETARYRLKYCLKGPLGPNQPTKKSSAAAVIGAFRVLSV